MPDHAWVPGRRATPRRPVATLADAFDPRRNSLAAIRLLLAAVVAVAHATEIGWSRQLHLGRPYLADLAVDGFFVLSGFLVARSYCRLRSVRRYAWHRFLRLFPGFWVCLVVTAVVFAPLVAVLDGREPWSVLTSGTTPAWRYVVANAALPIFQYDIAGLRTGVDYTAFDGSLWTLQYEALCYAVVAALGLSTLLTRRRWAVLALTGLVWSAAVAVDAGLVPFDVPLFRNDILLRFLLVFLLGTCAHLFAEHVRLHGALALASLAAVGLSVQLPDYRLTGALPFAYLCVYAMVRLPVVGPRRWDLSYGIYVYHWPVQAVLFRAGATVLGVSGFVVVSLSVAAVLAALSWALVERPALSLKDLTVSRRTPRAGGHLPGRGSRTRPV